MPRFVVVNNLERTIQVKQYGVVDRHALTLPSGGGRSSLHWVVGGRTESTRRRIRVRVDEFGWVWSGTVELHSEEDGSSSSTWCSSTKRENFNHFSFSCFCYVPQITRISLVSLVQENHSKINARMNTLL